MAFDIWEHKTGFPSCGPAIDFWFGAETYRALWLLLWPTDAGDFL